MTTIATSQKPGGSFALKYATQRVAYPYFFSSAILFFLQIVFGLIIAAQYVWPSWLMDSFSFDVGRATHLNLLIFWLLLGLMGAAYYLVPEETQSELFSTRLAYIQLAVLILAGLGTMISFWFLGTSQGKPFTESPMPWPLFIALGAVIFLFNMGMTLFRSRRWTAITVVLFSGMLGMAAVYLLNMLSFSNLVEDYFWWWWIIHLWVEGTWELVAAAITAFLLMKITGVDRSSVSRWLYLTVILFMFTGIIGIGHHYYWIGAPDYWLFWGALFSAFEPVPIILMTYDAFRSMRHSQTGPTNQLAWLFLISSAVGHFFGAGVWGFAQTMPEINKWTHGTLLTASHGHFAFFGAFGLLVLSAIYFMVPNIRGLVSPGSNRGVWSYRLMIVGMLFIILSFTMAGTVQVYLHRLAGMDFIFVRDQYVRFWIFWVWFFGLLLFLPGVTIYLLDVTNPRPANHVEPSQMKEKSAA
jgi:nitric oxide reductase subunit B